MLCNKIKDKHTSLADERDGLDAETTSRNVFSPENIKRNRTAK